MGDIKHCAVLVRSAEDVWEGTRTSLGLAAHNYYATLFLIDVDLEMNEALKENLEWLEEMECESISNRREHSIHGFKVMTIEEISSKLNDMDIVIPFGNRNDPILS
jgi:hypothetical protein